MLRGLVRSIKYNGVQNTFASYQQKFVPRAIANSSEYIEKFKDKDSLFSSKGLIPIYHHVKSLDGYNFANQTTWEGSIREGSTYNYNGDKPMGHQYVGEAGALDQIADNQYEGLLSSHMIEHTANPLKALNEWKRVLKPNGWLLIVVPHKDGTFDHKRPLTTIEHLREDFRQERDETDMTHFDEIIKHHDLNRDPLAGTKKDFIERSKRNHENRCFHHHVFNARLVFDMLDEAGFTIHQMDIVRPYHIMALCQSGSNEVSRSNSDSKVMPPSPFPSDQ